MSDLTREELSEILEDNRDKMVNVMKEMLKSSIDKAFSDFKNTMLERDFAVSQRINDNERAIDAVKRDVERIESKADKSLVILDGIRNVDLPKIEQIEQKMESCASEKNRVVDDIIQKTLDQEKRLQKLEKYFYMASGVLTVLVVVFEIVGALK